MINETYIYVPYEVSKQKNLKAREKLIISFVGGFQRGECHVSNDRLGQILGVSKRTISRDISSLVSRKYLMSKLVNENGICKGRILMLRKFQNTFER